MVRETTKGLSDRKRQSIYVGETLMHAIDQKFRDAAHELYPLRIDKASYLEACFKVALNHLDEVQTIIARRAQEHD